MGSEIHQEVYEGVGTGGVGGASDDEEEEENYDKEG